MPPQSRHAYLMQRDESSSLDSLQLETTMNVVKVFLASSTAAALIVGTLPALAYTGEELANQAKISITEARTIALKAHPGTITDEELEKEKGGSGLRYSFDIKRGKVTHEVGIDAQTGKVLENAKEGPNPD
jgi:uncharacterized membrane protein YkoI